MYNYNGDSMNNKERLMNIVKILKDNNILNDRSPKNVKKTIEDLGPTFIKIGQILSTRVDLIQIFMPKNYLN